jgi:hypothetical protein
MSKQKLTAADEKFIEQYIKPKLTEDDGTSHVTNPFSGESIQTTPLIATIIGMVQDLAYNDFHPWMISKWGLTKGNAVQKFDRARHIVLKLDSHVYMQILD